MITVTYCHPIEVYKSGRPGKPRATFLGHDKRERDFLFKNVRGYRGPKHPFVRPPYAKKIEDLARAKGFSVTVVQEPKPTPSECKAAVERFHRWLQTCGVPVEGNFES
jgi:hypothetical protein